MLAYHTTKIVGYHLLLSPIILHIQLIRVMLFVLNAYILGRKAVGSDPSENKKVGYFF